MKNKILIAVFCVLSGATFVMGQDMPKYKLLATTKTSTMQKEINEAAAQGYRIVIGAPTSGSEMTLFLSRDASAAEPYQYKLLATNRTGTMNKELNEAAAEGYRLIPSTMMPKASFMGGVEIVMVLEKSPKNTRRYEYLLLATNRTGTLQKEVTQATADGFVIVGMANRDENLVVMERSRTM